MSTVCPDCSAIRNDGRWCDCRTTGPKFFTRKDRRNKCNDRSLECAHFHHLINSLRSNAWSRPGGGGGVNAKTADFKVSTARYLKDMFGGERYSIVTRRSFTDFKTILFFVYRCETAALYWRDEFANLMGGRMTLWLGVSTSSGLPTS
jgi:hypothetical protein